MAWEPTASAVRDGPASAALAAWDAVVRAVRSAAPKNRLDDARLAVTSVLLPAGSGVIPGVASVRFAEQMTADVSTLGEAERSAALAELGPSALEFVQAVWACDVGTRARAAFTELFGVPILDDPMSNGPISEMPAWPAQELFLREVAKLSSLDPVTSELVRLRGARAHNCRLRRSLRSKTAVLAAGGQQMFDEAMGEQEGDLSPRHGTAVRVVDAFVWQPMDWPSDLVISVRELFSADEIVELVLDVMRNAANKIAVALAADAPHVADGVEYYDIDQSSGELQYGLSLA